MDISKKEKMDLLLKQLQVPEEYVQKYFQDSYLDKLQVYKKTKTWHFHLHVKQVLPADIYQLLQAKLKESFQQIAGVELTLDSDDKACNAEMIVSHWQHFIQSMTNLSPAYKDLIYEQVPRVNNNKIMLTARNEAEASALKKRLEEGFRQYCSKIGANVYSLEIDVKTEEADIQKFREQKAMEDKQAVLKTVQEKEKRAKEQPVKGNQPFMLGYKIQDEPMQMEEILEEERRVTVQGYIFSAEEIGRAHV